MKDLTPKYTYGVIKNIYTHFIKNQPNMDLKITPDQVRSIQEKGDGSEITEMAFDLDVEEIMKAMFTAENVNVVISNVFSISNEEIDNMSTKDVAQLFSRCEAELKKNLYEYLELNKNVYGLAIK